jgi:hypothetical protein
MPHYDHVRTSGWRRSADGVCAWREDAVLYVTRAYSGLWVYQVLWSDLDRPHVQGQAHDRDHAMDLCQRVYAQTHNQTDEGDMP